MIGIRPSSCPFCRRYQAGEYDSIESGVYTFEPLNPVVSGHRLFMPVEHVETAGAMPGVTGRTFQVAARWASEQNPAFNLITSAGADATQTVPHLHVHYLPRLPNDGLHLPWTPSLRSSAVRRLLDGRGR